MKKVFLLTSLFVASISMAQEATCPVTGKTASSAKESAAYDKHGSMSAARALRAVFLSHHFGSISHDQIRSDRRCPHHFAGGLRQPALQRRR